MDTGVLVTTEDNFFINFRALDLDDFKNVCGCEEYPLLRTINRVLRKYPGPHNNCVLENRKSAKPSADPTKKPVETTTKKQEPTRRTEPTTRRTEPTTQRTEPTTRRTEPTTTRRQKQTTKKPASRKTTTTTTEAPELTDEYYDDEDEVGCTEGRFFYPHETECDK